MHVKYLQGGYSYKCQLEENYLILILEKKLYIKFSYITLIICICFKNSL